ncbi:cyclin-like protein [Lepidopterella palustris CBS 459.81]|uniref:RNA polymerase II holoenzyme cyclin-like subunit n=1 Tax=Lepidopterella palustris CBS 459.81 TaxID=1314670 RepID=A0A8E2JIX0_9PEZI|nr:cyclin-like protein [Lepidopterella palustris CBS 459.81]
MRLTEDEIYRSSTQYRLWSYTADALQSLRSSTNASAAQRVKAAVKRQREARRESAYNSDAEKRVNGTDSGAVTPAITDKEVECLTVEEEQKIVNAFCGQAIALGQFLEFPINVVATGVQYLKRFYLFNSPMTYEPKVIMPSAMFLATKTEIFHMTAENFASRLPNTTAEQVLAPEYLITQALRFTFDVRHPFRGLNGGHMEMAAMANGKAAVLPSANKTPANLQQAMLKLPLEPNGSSSSMNVRAVEKRLGEATAKASKTLKTAALLTDVYFLYTPSQIWLAAYLLADEVLTLFYISSKFEDEADPSTPSGISKSKVIATVRACAAMLASHTSMAHATEDEIKALEKKEAEEVKAIQRKLHYCRDPDKMDLVKLNKAQKRDAGTDGKLEESKAKRRKLEREKNEKEADEFWGPELPKENVTGK